jgi:hypothetical protein
LPWLRSSSAIERTSPAVPAIRSPTSVERWSTCSLMRPLAWLAAPLALSWATWAFSRTCSLTCSVVPPSPVDGSVPY